MGKLIVGTFLILGLVFYELSGGSDFVPESQLEQTAEAETITEETSPEVTRTNASTLVNVAPETQTAPVAEIIQVAAEVVEELPVTEPVVAEAAPLDLRLVDSTRVNMRAGPGTNYAVLDTLNGGTETEVINVNADGWAEIRVTATGQTGWMAERLLTDG